MWHKVHKLIGGALPRSRTQLMIVLLILTVGFFARLTNLQASQQFLGDQGRDSLIVAKIFREHNLVFIGPVTSIGNLYLGPLYYYFMVPWLWLSYPSPMGPIWAVAICSSLGLLGFYAFAQRRFGAVIAALVLVFLATNATAVTLSRFSWNPNLAPLFSLGLIWSVWKAWRNPRWWLLAWICSAIMLQLHYITLLALVAAFGWWIVQFWRQKTQRSQLLWQAGLGLVMGLVFFVPLVLFDIKHGGINQKALTALIFSDNGIYPTGSSLAQKLLKIIFETHGRALNLLVEPFIGTTSGVPRPLQTLLIIWGAAGLFLASRHLRQRRLLLQLVWFTVVALAGASVYGHNIFAHYFAYLLPVTTLLWGLAFFGWWQIQPIFRWVSRALVVLLITGYLMLNIPLWPIYTSGLQLNQIHRTAQSIAQRVLPQEKFDIVLLSSSHDIDGMNYRYYLYTLDKEPLPREQQTEAEALFIINEEKVTDNVLDLPIWQIQIFPNKQPVEIYNLPNGPEITVLRRTR